MSDKTTVRWTDENDRLLFLGSYSAWLQFHADAKESAKKLAAELDIFAFKKLGDPK